MSSLFPVRSDEPNRSAVVGLTLDRNVSKHQDLAQVKQFGFISDWLQLGSLEASWSGGVLTFYTLKSYKRRGVGKIYSGWITG